MSDKGGKRTEREGTGGRSPNLKRVFQFEHRERRDFLRFVYPDPLPHLEGDGTSREGTPLDSVRGRIET